MLRMALQLCFSFPCPLFFSLELCLHLHGWPLVVPWLLPFRSLHKSSALQAESKMSPCIQECSASCEHGGNIPFQRFYPLLLLLMYTQKLSHCQRCSALENRVLPSVLANVRSVWKKIITSNGRVVWGILEGDYGWSCTLADLVPWEMTFVRQEHLGSMSTGGDGHCCHLLPCSPSLGFLLGSLAQIGSVLRPGPLEQGVGPCNLGSFHWPRSTAEKQPWDVS